MNFTTTVAIACLILCIASSCKKNLDGSGRTIKETRTIQAFSGIENEGPFKIRLQKSTDFELSIEGEDNIIPEIETVVINGLLKVRYRRPNVQLNHQKIIVNIKAPVVSQLLMKGSGEINSTDTWITSTSFISVSGSGSVTLNLMSDKLKTIISGSGTVFLSGKTFEGEYVLGGSGNLHGYDLINNNAKGNISGSAKCELNVVQNLNASISGSGIIYYSGNPSKVDVAVSGSGKVVKL